MNTTKGKYYWRCVDLQCDAEWYSDDPEDWTCPKCGCDRCANSMHPDDFDRMIEIVFGGAHDGGQKEK